MMVKSVYGGSYFSNSTRYENRGNNLIDSSQTRSILRRGNNILSKLIRFQRKKKIIRKIKINKIVS